MWLESFFWWQTIMQNGQKFNWSSTIPLAHAWGKNKSETMNVKAHPLFTCCIESSNSTILPQPTSQGIDLLSTVLRKPVGRADSEWWGWVMTELKRVGLSYPMCMRKRYSGCSNLVDSYPDPTPKRGKGSRDQVSASGIWAISWSCWLVTVQKWSNQIASLESDCCTIITNKVDSGGLTLLKYTCSQHWNIFIVTQVFTELLISQPA